MRNSLLVLYATLFFNSVFSQIASGKGKWLGNVINSTTPANFITYWNQVTPENAGKWGSVENSQDVMQWGTLDMVYDQSRTKGIPFKFHTLIWGQQEPAFIKNLSSSLQLKEVESWIMQACSRYPEAEYIDVVNEPLHAPPSYAAALGGQGITGWDWIVWAFETARKYCPKAKLILNDYNILSNDDNTSKFIEIIEVLKSKKLIDGIGEQGHFFETTPLQTIQDNLGRLISTGLPIYISEFDVNIANDQDQLEKYKQLFPIWWEHPAVKGVTLWGYQQNQIWRTNAYLLRSDGSERPAMTWLKGYIGLSTSIRPLQLPDQYLKIVTNPVTNHRLRLEYDEHIKKLEILSVMGSLLQTYRNVSTNASTMDIDLPHGLYFVKAYSAQGFVLKKFILD